jgi:hypothetical protein
MAVAIEVVNQDSQTTFQLVDWSMLILDAIVIAIPGATLTLLATYYLRRRTPKKRRT